MSPFTQTCTELWTKQERPVVEGNQRVSRHVERGRVGTRAGEVVAQGHHRHQAHQTCNNERRLHDAQDATYSRATDSCPRFRTGKKTTAVATFAIAVKTSS